MSYWADRQEQLKQAAEKDEAKLKKRLSSFYDVEFKRLDKEIAAYYQKYGKDNVIAYRNLLQSLSDEDKTLLIERMDDFAEKYPQYANLMPVRESIYKLGRLQGLQYSVFMTEAEIAGYTNEQIEEYLRRLSQQGLNYGMETLGFGKNFYSINDDIVRQFVDVPWCNGENFSTRIWNDTQKLAQYLSTDIAQGFARGDSYDRLVRNIRQRFSRVNRKDAYRLIYTEGTYVMAESSMQPFTEDFEQYRLSPVLDGRTCPICRGLREQVFLISERQPGVNFPPIHPWCRCSWEIVVDDWDKWMDEYVAKHGGQTAEKQASNIEKRMAVDESDDKTKAEIVKLEKQFSDMTDGYSYDDFMADFGSIENGFEGADELEIMKAKTLASKIDKLKSKLNAGEIYSKEKAVERLKSLGIEIKNYSSVDISDDIYSKFANFIIDFENNHPGYFDKNKLQLDSITIVDALKVKGVSAGGAYYSNSRSIKIMRKAIETKPKSKLITYSKSDDYELHFLAHEYGHYIADSLEKNFSITDYDIVQNSLLKYFDNDIFMAKTSNLMNDLGSYGSRNAKEAFAEAFAEAYTSENPRKFARIFKEELEKILKRKNK